MKIGFALRATVFGPGLIHRLAPVLDRSDIDSVWFPSVGRAFDSLDMCGIVLGRTERLRVGSGVIRSVDHEAGQLLPRAHTLSEGSAGRFMLGIGTGPGTGARAVQGLVDLTAKVRADYRGRHVPPILFAALRRGMLLVAHRQADGAILNFCPPSFVKAIAPKDLREGFTLGCYVKLFFAERDTVAKKMLVDEIKMYDRIPQYHAMFGEVGVSTVIDKLGPKSPIPEQLSEISLTNPTDEEVVLMLQRFERAGANLPIVYPYVSGGEGYKTSVVERLSRLA